MSEHIKLSKPLEDENININVVKEEMVKVNNQSSKRKYSERMANKRNKLIIGNAKSKIKELSSHEDGNASINVSKEIDSSLPKLLNENKPMSFKEKSILPYVIANEYVLSLIRNTTNFELSPEEELSHITNEPIFTRSKAKEKSKKQCLPAWPVSLPARNLQKIFRSSSETELQSIPGADIKSNAVETNENEEITGPKLSSGESETEVSGQDINDDCDSDVWHHFVCESVKHIDSTLMLDHSNDMENDPDFKVTEEDMSDYDELEFEDLPRDELNSLVAETFELALHEIKEEIDEVKTPNSNSEVIHTEINIMPTSVLNLISTGMTSDERLQLDEQLRMHVQLLSQSYLLSHGNAALNYITVSIKVLLEQIKMYAMHERTSEDTSAFYAQNLDGAVDIVNEFENLNLPTPSKSLPQPKKKLPVLPPHIKKTLATNKAFIYPELLPSCGFRNKVDVCKFFCTPEDNLISLGLERFSKQTNPVEHIHSFILPAKSVEQIKLRIKNSKSKKLPLTNPIKFYSTYNQAPQFPRVVRIFDPGNIKAPEDYSPDFLPKWMEPYSKPSKTHSINPVLAPSQTKPSSKVTVHRKCHKPLESKKYNPILPRGMHFSPLKQISPILKKYSQQRRIVPIISFSSSSPHKKSTFKTLKPKPTSTNANKDHKSNVISSNTQQLSTDSNKDLQTSSTTCETVEDADKESHSISKEDKVPNVENKENCAEEKSLSTEKEDKVYDGFTASKSPKVNASETEVSDEVDEEVLEDEQESTAAVVATAATTCKKHSISKKRIRHQRDLEASLALLQPTAVKDDSMKEEREVMFANSYLLRATEILKGNAEVYEQFLSTLSKYHLSTGSPVELYSDLKEILKDYPTLVRDFVVFLNSGQAKECGRYKEYIALSKIREFFRKIEQHFKNQPQHISRILRTFSQLHQQAYITSAEVINALQPLLRNQTHLMEELNHLLPDVSPPEYLMTDFEDVTMPNSDDDDDSSIDTCEEIIIPDTPDPYGGKDCPCDCHKSTTDNRLLNKIRHCVKCGVKFIDGRIYIQTGKVLKPAQVIYHVPPVKSPKTEKLNCQQMQPKPHQSSEAASKTHPDSDASSKTTLSKTQQATDTAIKTAHTKAQVSATALKCSPLSEKGSKTDVAHQKIEDLKGSETVQREVHGPSCSRLPCDVLEDAVFPTGATSSLNKSSPSDFSQIRDMISSFKKDSDSTDSNNQPTVSRQNMKWTRDEDKLIIYNCQRFGITKKAIFATATAMKTRTAQEVLNRFMHLMVFLSNVIKKQ